MEILDVVDEMGNPTGETVEREYAHRNGIRHRTSHLWIYKVVNNNYMVLLQQRSDDKDSYPGCYDISSAGHIPSGIGFVDSAIRELNEELGLTISPDRLVECGISMIKSDDMFRTIEYHDVQVSKVFLLKISEEESASIEFQRSEIQAVRWIEFEELIDYVINDKFKHCILLSELEMIKKKMI